VAAGLPPSEFWDQSYPSFAWIMHGANQRMRAQRDLALAQAWHGERFARTERLKPLSDYLDEMGGRPRRKMKPAEIIARFRQMAEGGAAIRITKVEPNG